MFPFNNVLGRDLRRPISSPENMLMNAHVVYHMQFFPDELFTTERSASRTTRSISSSRSTVGSIYSSRSTVGSISSSRSTVGSTPSVTSSEDDGDDEQSNQSNASHESQFSISPTMSEVEVEHEPESVSSNLSRKRTHSEVEDADQKEVSDDEDGSMCPICMDHWTTSGPHRVCSLKCGHLFGQACIERWVGESKKSCPTCKTKVSKKDIRNIFVKKLIAVDTTELENVKGQLTEAIADRNRFQLDLAKALSREQILHHELDVLRTQLTVCQSHQVFPVCSLPQSEYVKLYMDKSLEISKLGENRVFDTKPEYDLLVASIKSPERLFAGFGLKKIAMSGYKQLAFLPLHKAQIRDVAFHPENNSVLTASMDRCFKLVDNVSNSVSVHGMHESPLWCCCWDLNNSHMFYLGTQNGQVIKHDMRNITEPLCTLTIDGDMSPLVSLASIPAMPGQTFPSGGLIMCKLNSIWINEVVGEDFVKHPIALDGPFVSMRYHVGSNQMLVSSRPNCRTPFARHNLCTMSRNDQGAIDCNVVHCYQGGAMQKFLSKSSFISNMTDYVAAYQENSKSVCLWSIKTGEKVTAVPARDTVLDLKGFQNHFGNFLISLTDRKVEFFKFS